MKIINLRLYYPHYEQDKLVEVSIHRLRKKSNRDYFIGLSLILIICFPHFPIKKRLDLHQSVFLHNSFSKFLFWYSIRRTSITLPTTT